ncbi:perlucin-like protein [Ruditapes philippinarum]|uniref:perlucin-like protein n=1 Tax=Ruditapes philippinarum TaxID=129788 RepID=UPI00295B9C8D|nr:perlucin-like protein [Ruditapes philippinarum]
MSLKLSGKPCPDDWLKTSSSCYYFSTDSKNWTDALEACKAFDSKLVEISDIDEDNIMRTKARNVYSNYWIGLTDQRDEGVWIWSGSNTRLTSEMYTNWSPGQPDDARGRGEDCASLEKRYSFRWNDEECYMKLRYVCEINLPKS